MLEVYRYGFLGLGLPEPLSACVLKDSDKEIMIWTLHSGFLSRPLSAPFLPSRGLRFLVKLPNTKQGGLFIHRLLVKLWFSMIRPRVQSLRLMFVSMNNEQGKTDRSFSLFEASRRVKGVCVFVSLFYCSACEYCWFSPLLLPLMTGNVGTWLRNPGPITPK